jgi:hypothetical protein
MHDLKTKEIFFEEIYGGRNTQSYIKVKEVAQNLIGNKFACCFYDDGIFGMRTFGRFSRTLKDIQANEIRFNEMFGLDNFTLSNEAFHDPFINCCFLSDTTIFVNFFYNYT